MADLRLDSIGLREAAEYAASLRTPAGDAKYLIVSYDPEIDDYTLKSSSTPPAPSPGTIVIPVTTESIQPERPVVTGIEVTLTVSTVFPSLIEKKSADLQPYDALFWSEAAVEKFLFPYYASKYQWAAAEVLTLLSNVFYGFVPSFTSGVTHAESKPAGGADTVPFAMAHLPRSDYVPMGMHGVGEAGPTNNFLLHDLWVLSHDLVTGDVVHRPLAYYAELAQKP